MLKASTLFLKVNLQSNIFLCYMIVWRNDDKGHVKLTVVCLGRESFDSQTIVTNYGQTMYRSTLSQ